MHSASVPTCLGIGSRPTNLLLYSDQGEFFPGRFDTSGSMIPHLVPEIEGGYPERDGEGGEEEEEEGGEGLVLENSRSWICNLKSHTFKILDHIHNMLLNCAKETMS